MDKDICLILASHSPRRAEILRRMHVPFDICVRPVDESVVQMEEPVEHVRALARAKAEAVLPDIGGGVVVGADTIVYFQNRILGKPKSRNEARHMLKGLSGASHQVYTGLALIRKGDGMVIDTACTNVCFRNILDWEIDAYIRSDGPFDKAGGYGIQESSGMFVENIKGCYYNVVGFPAALFFSMLVGLCGESWVRALIQSKSSS